MSSGGPLLLAQSNTAPATEQPESAVRRCLSLAFLDVFVYILRLFLDSVDDWSSDNVLRGTLRSVSRLWRLVLAENPALWKRIFLAAHMSPEYVQHTFRCAGATDKTVIISFAALPVSGNRICIFPNLTAPPERDSCFITAVATELSTAAATVRKLSVHVDDFLHWNAFVVLLHDVRFTALKSLAVTYSPQILGSAAQNPRPFFISSNLDHLHLDFTPISCVSNYTHVNYLALSGPAFSTVEATPASNILEALRLCNRIERLTLLDIDFREEELQHVLLENAKELTFSCGNLPHASGHPCGRAVSYISTPNLSSLTIDIAHRRGVRHFARYNTAKLRGLEFLKLHGEFSHFTNMRGTDLTFLVDSLHELDITGLQRVPALVGPGAFTPVLEYHDYIIEALRLPGLRVLRVPRSVSSPDPLNLARARAAIAQAFALCPEPSVPVIIEEHARCRSRAHVVCATFTTHACSARSLPHDDCALIRRSVASCSLNSDDPRIWPCTDRAHEKCGRRWSVRGVEPVPSSRPERRRVRVEKRAYNTLFLD